MLSLRVSLRAGGRRRARHVLTTPPAVAQLADSHEDVFIFHGVESWTSIFPHKYPCKNVIEKGPPYSDCLSYRDANLFKRVRVDSRLHQACPPWGVSNA